jgi:DNA-binding SARP family transcriptional activator
MGADSLELRLFAVPSLTLAGLPLRFPSRKGLALLILLAISGIRSREKLANWLWVDSPQPKDALRNALAQVNKVLIRAGLSPLKATRQTVAWQQEIWVDALALTKQISEKTLLELRGAWLEGFVLEGAPEFDTWAAEQGAYFVGLLQQQLEQTAERLAKQEQLEPALLLAQQRLRLDALNETAYQQLMRLQRSAGREAEARETLLLCQSTLQRELGLPPSAKTLGVLNEPLPTIQRLEDAPVGRFLERSWLENLRSKNGFGLLLGEAGAGKTAIVRAEFPSAIWLECRPNDAALPYSSVLRTVRKRLRENVTLPVWAQIVLARFLPELGATTEAFDQMRLYMALNLFFPTLSKLVVDDLHFMDEMSAAWFWQLAQQRLDEHLAPTILTYRPNEIAFLHQTSLLQLERQGAVRQILQPLTLTEISVWLERLGIAVNLASEFMDLTGGNALFFKEAALAYRATGDFGRGLLPLLQQRLNTLGQLEWQLVQFVAVAGSLATLQRATQVLKTDQLQLALAWAQLETLDVLRGNSFAHDLLRDATLNQTPISIQAALSSTMLDHLEQRIHVGEVFPSSVLAELAGRATDPRREAHYRLLAGLEVYQLGFMRTGIEHLERCLDLLEQQPMLLSLADLELLYLKLMPIYRADVYNAPHLARVLQQLLSIARTRGTRQLEAIALATQADWIAQTQQDFFKARLIFDQATELAGQDQQVKYLIFDLRSWAENSAGQTQLALEYANQGLALSQHDLSLKFRALEAIYMFEQNLSRWQQAKNHALEAADAALDSKQMRHGRPYALTMAAYCALLLGDLSTCEKHIGLALQLLENSQWDNALGFATRVYAQLLLERDDLSLALEQAEQSVSSYQRLVNHFALCSSYSTVARIHLAALRPENCLKTIEAAEQALALVSSLPIISVMQSTLDNLRCSAQTQMGKNAFHSALRAVKARVNPPETIGGLLIIPREDELQALLHGGEQQLARTELEQFLGLHPDNPRVQILHLRAKAIFERNPKKLLCQARELALELGMTMQARMIQI